jgi:hypothetical protein
MIDRNLIQSILLKLDEYSTQRALPVGSGGFRELGDDQTVLEHLLYIKTKGLITGQEMRTGLGDRTLNRIAEINLTDRGQDAILDLRGKGMTVHATAADANTGIDIFISHSSRDREIAARLIELLRNALNIHADGIRCTSVEGYRLKVGADTNAQLRQEVHDAKVFIGLITPASVESAYVLFELGARWGAGRFLAPLLASREDVLLLRGPISGLNALSCDSREQMFQLVEDIGEELNIPVKNQASYSQHIDALVRECQIRQQSTGDQNQPQPRAAENYDENDIIVLLGEYVRSKRDKYNKFFIRFVEADRALGLKDGSAKQHIETAALNNEFTIISRGSSTIELQFPYTQPRVVRG